MKFDGNGTYHTCRDCRARCRSEADIREVVNSLKKEFTPNSPYLKVIDEHFKGVFEVQ